MLCPLVYIPLDSHQPHPQRFFRTDRPRPLGRVQVDPGIKDFLRILRLNTQLLQFFVRRNRPLEPRDAAEGEQEMAIPFQRFMYLNVRVSILSQELHRLTCGNSVDILVSGRPLSEVPILTS